jgi:predicted O-linked N-acetylglucosamine transferase (SPINDLY family)
LLSEIYEKLNRSTEALNILEAGLKRSPDNLELNEAAANLLSYYGFRQESTSYYNKLVRLDPENPKYYKGLGSVLNFQDKNKEAVAVLEEGMKYAEPGSNIYKEILFTAVSTLVQILRVERAAKYVRELLSYESYNIRYLVPAIYVFRYICDWKSFEKYSSHLKICYRFPRYYTQSLFMNMIENEDSYDNLSCAKVWEWRLFAPGRFSQARPVYNPAKVKPRNGNKIRIGYLSADFRDHATMHLMRGVFRHHDKEKFELYFYSIGADDGSFYRGELKENAQKFLDISEMSDLDVAEEMFADGIDILMDLKGHTGGARFPLLHFRPAPIQVTYLGFPGTTGLDCIDYAIVDKVVLPEEKAGFFSEKPAYMPHSYQANDNEQKITEIELTREEAGLPSDTFIFASFNQAYKIDSEAFGVWCEILNAVPNSILWLEKTNETAVDNLRVEAEKRGIDSERLHFYRLTKKEYHLARLKLADLVLDTRVVNGHTSTSDCLWAGVPVITKTGEHFSSRVSSSLLRAIGLPELVKEDYEGYRQLAIELANDPSKLKELRSKLAANKKTEPLYNTEQFTKDIESLYSKMVERHKQGEKPVALHFDKGDIVPCEAAEVAAKESVVHAYWYHETPNWGDSVNEALLESLSGGKKPVWHFPLQSSRRDHILCTGSILGMATQHSIVWGAGYISQDASVREKPKAIHAVRGPLTRELLLRQGIDCPEVYGDPALLYPRIYHPKKEKKYRLGIVAHYIDQDHPWLQNMPDDVLLINVKTADVNLFVDQLLQCEKVASSSLHGLIAADAYGIPSTWLRFSNKVIGGNFKFLDYFASVGRKDKQPLLINEGVTLEDVENQFYDYQIDIDLDALMDACPFKAQDKLL